MRRWRSAASSPARRAAVSPSWRLPISRMATTTARYTSTVRTTEEIIPAPPHKIPAKAATLSCVRGGEPMHAKPLNRSLDANPLRFWKKCLAVLTIFIQAPDARRYPCAIVMFTGAILTGKLAAWRWICWTATPPCWAAGRELCDYLLTQSRIPAEPDAVSDRTFDTGGTALQRTVRFAHRRRAARRGGFDAGDAPALDLDARRARATCAARRRHSPSCCAITFRCCGGSSAPERLWQKSPPPRTGAKTEYCLCYDSTLAPKETIDALRERLTRWRFPFCWTVPTLRRSSSRTS